MRRLMPMWSSLIAVLLLVQWAGAMAACLPHLTGPAAILCHVDDTTPSDQAPANPAHTACPLCAPLPPVILAAPPPFLLPPFIAFYAAPLPSAPQPAPALSRTAHQQPRAPPVLS